MNCPHGWVKIDEHTSCGACDRERDAAIGQLSRHIASEALDAVRLGGHCFACRLQDGAHDRGCSVGKLAALLERTS